MLAVLSKEIYLPFTLNTIMSDDGKLPKIMAVYMIPYSIILNICCLFLELYPEFNYRSDPIE